MDGHAGPVRALGRVRESCPRACVARRQRTAGKQVARGSRDEAARGLPPFAERVALLRRSRTVWAVRGGSARGGKEGQSPRS